jgi:O-antigen ligase
VNAALTTPPALPGPARHTAFESRALCTAASWSFLLLVATLPWAIAPMSISTGLCVAMTLVLMLAPGALRRARTPVEWPALGWLVALTLAATFALDPLPSFQRVPKGLLAALVLLASFHASDPRTGRRALGVLLASGALFALVGLVPFLMSGAGLEGRARGMVGHYMTFAGQLLLITSLASGIVARASGRWRLGALVVALITSVALAATFTRSAWIGLLVALGIIVMATRPRWTPALLIAAVVALVLAPAPYRTRALSAFDVHHPTNRERTFMWEGGLRMFRDRPLTGVGLQDMKPVYDRYKPAGAHERAGHLHSVPVQIAASMGLIGLVAFAWLYGALLRAATRGLRPTLARGGLATGVRLGVAAGLAGFLVAGLFEWNFGDEELLYLLYTLVGIAWAARNWDLPAA